MRKCIPFILVLFLIVSCSSEAEKKQSVDTTTGAKDTATVDKDTTTQKAVEEKSDPTLPQYDSVVEALEEAGDFSKEEGNLKVVSSDPLHIQVSSWGFKENTERMFKEDVRRDIIYVAFQLFAKTDINEITITSVPQDFENKGTYMSRYKETVTANRETAKEILENNTDISKFEELYKYSDGYWLPNDEFAALRYDRLNSVYRKLNQ